MCACFQYSLGCTFVKTVLISSAVLLNWASYLRTIISWCRFSISSIIGFESDNSVLLEVNMDMVDGLVVTSLASSY